MAQPGHAAEEANGTDVGDALANAFAALVADGVSVRSSTMVAVMRDSRMPTTASGSGIGKDDLQGFPGSMECRAIRKIGRVEGRVAH
jgi:hypothetical protein